ncbi:ABC transporter ATP-binding protein [Desulfocurvibacter africanus]|uniref:ABC transporter ATP-binding protein n=1 Tax=Desulfocurvibacter africanus TaxID=873 RepID=UPI002FDAF345
MSGEDQVLLALRGVGKLYGRKLVVKGVNLDVRAGEVWLVVGPNGAGKSTLLGIMAGLVRPTAGSRELCVGQEKLAYLGHQTFLYPRLTARENLVFWARMYGHKPQAAQIDAALERAGLAAAAEEQAGRFSRGMAQRLSLARVFLVEPSLIFLDEPGTGLDARSMQTLRHEIAAARDRGVALVWVSHQVSADLPLADHVLAIGESRMRYAGLASDFEPTESMLC